LVLHQKLPHCVRGLIMHVVMVQEPVVSPLFS
jgi:hypothetical protein